MKIFTMQRVGWLWAANSIGLMLYWKLTENIFSAQLSAVCFFVAVILWMLGSEDL